MGLMEDADTDSDDWLKLGKLAGKIHEFARAHSIPVITAVQLNRLDPSQKKSETKSIGLHRIGRSSLIAHHATVIIQIETRPDEETHDDFVYHIIKNRHGQSNKSHSVWKNFNKCSIIDRPYDIECANSWQPGHDISIDISEIIGEMSS
jgi:replicative DNA helicase